MNGARRPARGVFTGVLAALVLVLGPPRAAPPDSLTVDENVRLMHGETIARPQTLTPPGDGRYVGGVTYTVVEARANEVASMLDDVGAFKEILPRTKRAEFVGTDGDDVLLELSQGNALFETSYTLRVRRDPGAHEVRFWLDPSRPHGIRDAWGFFRYEPLAQVTPGVPRVLLTYGILVDLGPGLVRDLFEERLRAMMLSVPQRVRAYVWHAIRPRRAAPSPA
jgi:hypothetical protein